MKDFYRCNFVMFTYRYRLWVHMHHWQHQRCWWGRWRSSLSVKWVQDRYKMNHRMYVRRYKKVNPPSSTNNNKALFSFHSIHLIGESVSSAIASYRHVSIYACGNYIFSRQSKCVILYVLVKCFCLFIAGAVSVAAADFHWALNT